jgi:hypothetical protein
MHSEEIIDIYRFGHFRLMVLLIQEQDIGENRGCAFCDRSGCSGYDGQEHVHGVDVDLGD